MTLRVLSVASEAVPPVLLLMMLLKPEAGSNEGSFMKAVEFESVWAEGSVSINEKDATFAALRLVRAADDDTCFHR